MIESDGNTELTVGAGPTGIQASAKGKKISEVVAVLSLAGLFFLGYLWHMHDQASKENISALAKALDRLSQTQTEATAATIKAQQQATAAQREMTCIISLPVEKREAEFTSPFGFCKRITQ